MKMEIFSLLYHKSIAPFQPNKFAAYHPHMEFVELNGLPKGPKRLTLKTSSDKEQIRRITDVSISGFGRVFGKKVTWWKRAIWASILIICTGLTLSQVWDRVTYYKSTPVNVNVRVTRNVSLLFPLVTFCNKNFYNVTALEELRRQKMESSGITDENITSKWNIDDFIEAPNRTSRIIWESTKHELSQMLKECWFGRGIKCDDIGEWTKVFTVLGVCYQFRTFNPVYVSGLFNNMYVKLQDREDRKYNGESGFKVHIHDPKDDALIDVRTHGSTVDAGWGKDARIAVREFKTIPTYARPCVLEPNYSSSKCVSVCFMKAMVNNTGCLMPYMEGKKDPSTEQWDSCSTPELYKLGSEVEVQLLFQGGWRPTSCNCPKQCYENIYTVYTEAVQTGSTSARLRIFFQDLTYDEVSEELAYDTIALLCDIGGTLGLLLGASVLTIFELVEIACEKAMVVIKKKQ